MSTVSSLRLSRLCVEGGGWESLSRSGVARFGSLFLFIALGCTAFDSTSAGTFVSNAEEYARIEQALPRQPIVAPTQPRRLLIFTLNVGYGGHPSIAYANEAFSLMGQRTGAFETVVTNDPAVFERESLKRFDAVFFNNTVGNCFTNADLRQNLLEFITGGGGLLGVHGTSVAFTRWPGAIEDWPEFGRLIGARGANHKDSTEHVWVKLDDPGNPLNRVFGGQGFEYRDEFFRVHEPYSRNRVRVLFSIDTAKTDVNAGQPRGDTFRADNDYALAWIRNYGRGRVFYCTIAHNPYVFWDPKMLQFYLGAIQFALGDLEVSTIPSAKLTPTIRAQEKLGWRLGLEDSPSGNTPFFETIHQAAELGLCFVNGKSSQPVSRTLPMPLDARLSDDQLSQVRLELDAAGLRLLTYEVGVFPGDESDCRRLFEFGRKLGIETFVGVPPPAQLDLLERLCTEYRINLALRAGDSDTRSPYLTPKGLLKLCEGRSARIGACGDLGQWLRSGSNPVRIARQMKNRLLIIQMQDLDKPNSRGKEVPWGTGAAALEKFLAEIQRLGLRPTCFSLQTSSEGQGASDVVKRNTDFFNRITLKLTSP